MRYLETTTTTTTTTTATPSLPPFHRHCHHHHHHYHHHPMLSASSASSSSSSSSSSLSSSSPCRYVRRVLLLSLTMAAVTAVAVGVSSMKRQYAVHVAVPRDVPVRKVRAFSTTPELSQLTDNPASLALVSRLQLLDLRDCQGNLSLCQTTTVCDGGENDLLCRCRRGYYFHQQKCRECRTSCLDGHYLLSPCSTNADAVCTPCTYCSGSQYEAAVCTSTRDTICVDVTFPMGILPMNTSHYQDDGSPITVSHSANVFLERLVSMKELETPMYVTNNQQTQDFVWHRESGIDIVVGISGVFLIPEYRELSVADDSQFFLTQSRETQRTLDLFSHTQKEYCRHPVPDYYYLHLEVIKNRTTAAQVVRCDSQDPTVPRCPPDYKDGDRFLKWDINQQCDKYHATGQPPDLPVLKDGFNNVVCTDETSMDRDIFQLSRPVTLEMMFPSKDCDQARQQCGFCLSSASCSGQERTSGCCGLPCYNQDTCHKFHGPDCPPAQVECASGEVHRFTVMPVFSSMPREWHCHLTYQQPAYLYNISYSISVPSLGFHAPVQTYTARAANLRHHRHHSNKFHFIQVWHDTRMAVFPDVLLKGDHRELNATNLSHMQPYVLHSLKRRAEFSRRRGFFTSKKEETAYTTAVQFERPFLYSSTSWYGDGCAKNVSGIFPNQTVYRNDAMKVTAKKMEREGSFWYQVSHGDRSPYIKLSVGEGESVLQWFQGQTAPGLIVTDTLTGSLAWDYIMYHWTITVAGTVKACPSILTLQIFSKMMTSCAGIYDILVACPNNFTLTFNLSRTGDGDLPDIFVLMLNDSAASHQLVLTSVVRPASLPVASLHAGQGDDHRRGDEGLSLWSSVLAVLVLCLIGLGVIFGVYVHIKCSVSQAAGKLAAQNQQPTETATLNNQATKPAEPRHHRSALAKRCLCVFVVLYLVYSIVFSFCVTLSILYLTHHAVMGGVGGMANFSRELQAELNESFHKVQLHESQEEIRLFRSVESRFQGCAYHLQRQNREFLQNYQDHVTDLLSHVYLEDGAIQSLAGQSIVQNTSVYAEEIQQFVVDCNKTVQSILDRFNSHFLVHAKEVARNSWLDFPREVFLAQEGDPPSRKYMSSDQLARFLHWLQVDKTDDLFAISDMVAARQSELKLPSPSEHLKHTVTSPFEALLSSLPSEPMVAAHTFLVLDPPPPSLSPVPVSLSPISTDSLPSHPKPAFLYSEGSSDQVEFHDDDVSHAYNGSHSQPLVDDQGSSQTSDEDVEADEELGLWMYIMIGLFLLMDVLLFVFRMSWMVNQLKAARGGYEDRIPTDPVCQKLLAIQTGYPMSGVQDIYQLPGYSLDHKDNPTAEERASESEFNVYFCQSYPKSKDDILREIMAQKMSSTEQNLGQERPPEAARPAGKSQLSLKELGVVRRVRGFCYWLFRVLISHLLWRFVVTTLLVVLLCVLMYTADFWLTADNLRVLVGGQSALRDLHLQVHMTNRHLAGLASHLSKVLDEHTAAVQSEISLATALLSTTLSTQRELLVSLLERVCSGAGTPTCNVSSYSALPLPILPTWQACNFIPAQPHLYQDISGDNLDQMVAQQLSPLLQTAKYSLSSMCAIVIAVLYLLFLCHAAATVARYYLLLWGHLPRVQIFQISENTSMMLDAEPDSHKPMQRSASWLESCESGVYVGENEADTNHPNRDV